MQATSLKQKEGKTKKGLALCCPGAVKGEACALPPEYLCSPGGKFPRLNRCFPAAPGLVEIALLRVSTLWDFLKLSG